MADFPPTRISVIERIRKGDAEARNEALGIFVEDYRPALMDFLVKAKRVDPVDADDLVNDFILNKVMQGKVLELANGQGRFRSALRTCIQRYLIDSIRKKSREPITPRAAPEPVAGSNTESNEVDPLDRVWATAIFTGALAQMRQESPHWELFVDRVLTQPPLGYTEIIERHGYTNPQKASNSLMTAKRTFNRILSANIEAQTSLGAKTGDSEIKDEAQLLRVLLQDTDMVKAAVNAVRDRPSISYTLSHAGTIGSAMVFMDPSADAAWQKEDIAKLFQHLLDQSFADIGLAEATHGELILRTVLDPNDSTIQRADLVSLKEHFNRRGKSGNSDLPRRIDVAMTFALICRFALSHGMVEDITSMSLAQLVDRVKQMADKPWLPEELKTLFALATRRFKQ
jgi:DNA-directed RNA polymerase specialized sigma24 family protein